MIPQPEKLQRTPLKENIEDSFKSTRMIASVLRNMINCNCPGNKETAFREFNGTFDYFFGLSEYKEELNTDIITKCNKWFDAKKTASDYNIKIGLALFRNYSQELFTKGLIKYE